MFGGNADFQETKTFVIQYKYKNYNLNIINININLNEFSLLFGIEPFVQIFLRLYYTIWKVINGFFSFFFIKWRSNDVISHRATSYCLIVQ